MIYKLTTALLFLGFINLGFSQEPKNVFDAIRKDNDSLLKEFVQKNSTLVNSINDHGFSPLILASYYHKLNIANWLLKNKAEINYISEMGTALMAATYKGDQEMVMLLLQNNADVNISDAKGTTALHLACIFNNTEIAKLLIENNAYKDIKDAQNKTPLDYAILNKNIEIIKLFEHE